MKVAIALRMLAGGSYLDLSLVFDVSQCIPVRVLHEFCNWINDDRFISFDSSSYLNDENRLKEVANGFRSRSNGLFEGCIGAVDGWLVKI